VGYNRGTDDREIQTIHVVFYATGNDGRSVKGKSNSSVPESGGHSSLIETDSADQVRASSGDV
jgi:hypothetical protein